MYEDEPPSPIIMSITGFPSVVMVTLMFVTSTYDAELVVNAPELVLTAIPPAPTVVPVERISFLAWVTPAVLIERMLDDT